MFPGFSEELRRNPFIRITLAFIAGIIVTNLVFVPVWITTILFFVSLAVLVFFKVRNRYGNEFISGLTINIVLLSAGMFFTTSLNEKARNDLESYKTGNLIGIVDEDPKINEKTTTVKVIIIAVKNGDNWQSTEGNTMLYLERNDAAEKLQTGDKIIFSPQLNEIENKGNPEEFDFKKYLSYSLILTSDYLTSDEWQLLPDDAAPGIRHIFLRFRTKLVGTLKEFGLSNDELAVASALALGYKDNLSDEVRHAYSSAGAMHILAVSGMHVGIVYGVIVFLLSFFKSEKLKIPKVVLSIILVWAYAALTGLSPSVSRAALMFSILALGRLQKHGSGSLNAIAASAFILLLINPYNLYNLGFQLSYVAVIGIILLYEPIYNIYKVKNKLIDKVWSLTSVSVAAQIATAPLCMYYFHQFSNYFLITNYLLIPVSTIAIWLVIAVFIFSPITAVATFLTKILAFTIKTMNFFATGIESLPFSVTTDIQISFPQLILLYFIISALAIFFFNTKMYRHLYFTVAAVVLYVAIGLVGDLQNRNQKYFIVYNINKVTAINVIEGRKNVVFASLDSTTTKQIEFSAKNNWLKKGLESEKYINLKSGQESVLSNVAATDNTSVFYKRKFISFGEYKAFVVDDEFNALILDENYKKPQVDFLILSNNPDLSLIDMSEYFNFKQIIIASSNSQKNLNNWKAENDNLKLDIFDVAEQGAFVLSY